VAREGREREEEGQGRKEREAIKGGRGGCRTRPIRSNPTFARSEYESLLHTRASTPAKGAEERERGRRGVLLQDLGIWRLAMSLFGCRLLTGGSSTRRFKPDLVKKLIQECLAEKLTGEKYHVDKVWLPLALLHQPFLPACGPTISSCPEAAPRQLTWR
jgi:hypothetical protein